MPRRNAPEIFSPRGTGLPTVMRKNQPLVPRSNFGGKACARTAPCFRSQTLLVPGHGGGGYGPTPTTCQPPPPGEFSAGKIPYFNSVRNFPLMF